MLVIFKCFTHSSCHGSLIWLETTGFHGPIFADPTRELYHALGMDIETVALTPSGQEKRSYLTLSTFANVMQSIWVRLPFALVFPGDELEFSG